MLCVCAFPGDHRGGWGRDEKLRGGAVRGPLRVRFVRECLVVLLSVPMRECGAHRWDRPALNAVIPTTDRKALRMGPTRFDPKWGGNFVGTEMPSQCIFISYVCGFIILSLPPVFSLFISLLPLSSTSSLFTSLLFPPPIFSQLILCVFLKPFFSKNPVLDMLFPANAKRKKKFVDAIF